MATLEQIGEALRRADAAGATEDARKLASAYASLKAQLASAPKADPRAALAERLDPPNGAKPGSREYADWALARKLAGKPIPSVSAAPPEDTTKSLGSKFDAAFTAGVDAIPIAGPALLQKAQEARGAVQGLTPEQVARETQIEQEANPGATMAGSITGTVAPFVMASTLPVVSTILGVDVAAPLAANVILGAGSQKLISHLDTAARGQEPNPTAENIAAGAGAAGPIVGKLAGAGLNKLGEVVVDPIKRAFQAATGQGDDAARAAIAKTVRADMGAGQVMSPADEAAAVAAGQPIVNADRFGTATRQLARTAANTDPTAREALSEFVQDRFLTQNTRAADWVARNTGAPTDIYTVQKNLSSAAKGVNNAQYKTAYAAPAAKAIWTPELEQLMESANFRSAVRAAVKTSNEEAALTGAKPIQSPFIFHKGQTPRFVPMDEGNAQFQWSWDRSPKTGMAAVKVDDNIYTAKTHEEALRKAIRAEGPDVKARVDANPEEHIGYQVMEDLPYSLASKNRQPTLEFWDHVQRALRRRSSQLAKSGETDYDAGQVMRARAQLNEVLDKTVPEFAAARGGAARWFGAEDALEAGQKFVTTKPSDLGEATAAFNKFSPQEKKLFASGFASSLLDKIGSTPDTANVVNKVFANPQARAQIELALGARAAKELESFVRIEDAMQLTKQAIQGGSNTVQQLLALGIKTGGSSAGIGYGTGAAFGGLDPRNWGSKAWTMALLGAAGRAGIKAVGKRVDQSVMHRIAKLLASEDPKMIQKAVENASRSDRAAAAVQAIESGLAMVVRGAGLGAAGEATQ